MYIYQPGLPGQRTSSPEDTHTAYLRTERAHGRKTNKQAPIRSCRLVHQLLKDECQHATDRTATKKKNESPHLANQGFAFIF